MKGSINILATLIVLVLIAGGLYAITRNRQTDGTFTAQYSTPVTLPVGKTAIFPNSVKIKLVKIDDSRCPEGTTCIWQGELSANLELTGPGFESGSTIRLGTVMNQSISPINSGLNFNLQSATLTSATIVVTKVATPIAGKGVEDIKYPVTGILFGEPVYGDLDADSDLDAAVLLVDNSAGSGTFYYAVLALNTGGTYKSTNALLIGDRIAPQTVEIHDGVAVYNYATRKTGEPFTTPPSVGKSLYVHLDKTTGTIGELVQNFEGEADPSKMTLGMTKWVWQEYSKFTLTFGTAGKLVMTTDCNSGGANYEAIDGGITINAMITTLMYCEGSQESYFTTRLGEVSKYKFTSRGELILTTSGGETLIFR